MSKVRLPDYTDLMYPTLEVIDQSGGSATIRQLEEEVPRRAVVTDQQMAVVYRGKSKVLYLMRWARTYLKKVGAVDNPTRGVWSLTPEGERYLRMDPVDAGRKLRQKDKEIRDAARMGVKPYNASNRRQEVGIRQGHGENNTTRIASNKTQSRSGRKGRDWRSNLLTILEEMEPIFFERLMLKLLGEMGFDDLERTSRMKDGDVEGVGKMSVLNLSIYIQCKHYIAEVGPGAIRRFRAAMAGYGDKGLFITTGFFSDEAKTEAARMTPDVGLVDGEQLCDLLKKHRLGVAAEERVVEEVTLDKDFFTGL